MSAQSKGFVLGVAVGVAVTYMYINAQARHAS